jgi:hypothetical protein
MPALSGLWASRACYPVEPRRHWRAVRPTGEMPRTNLCNRLTCHEYPRSHPFPSSGLSPFRPPRSSSCIRLGGSPAFRPRPSSATPDCHCWLSSLGSAAQLVLRRPAATRPSPPKGRAVSRTAVRVGVVVPPRTQWSGPQTPHVATRSLARHPELTRRSQNPLPRTPTKGYGCSSPRRLPPASPTADARARARTTTAWAATGTLASPPVVQLPTCVHAPTRGALDPSAYRLFAGAPGPHAACQLLQ